MSFSINQVVLVGNCTKNPELRYTPNKVPVLNFSVATNRSIKDESAEGGYKDVATFHNVTIFGKVGEWLHKNLIKGQAVTVTGRIDNGSYEKEGKTFYTSKIIADDVIPHRQKNATNVAHKEESDQGYEESLGAQPDPTEDWGEPH